MSKNASEIKIQIQIQLAKEPQTLLFNQKVVLLPLINKIILTSTVQNSFRLERF